MRSNQYFCRITVETGNQKKLEKEIENLETWIQLAICLHSQDSPIVAQLRNAINLYKEEIDRRQQNSYSII